MAGVEGALMAVAGGAAGRPGTVVVGGEPAAVPGAAEGAAAAAAPLSGVADENPGSDGDGACCCCCCCCCDGAAARGSLLLPSFAPSLKPHHMKTTGVFFCPTGKRGRDSAQPSEVTSSETNKARQESAQLGDGGDRLV